MPHRSTPYSDSLESRVRTALLDYASRGVEEAQHVLLFLAYKSQRAPSEIRSAVARAFQAGSTTVAANYSNLRAVVQQVEGHLEEVLFPRAT